MPTATLFLYILPIVLLSLAIHEYAHAKVADSAGDPTPRIFGRVTMNPFNHLDPMGTLMIVLSSMAGFGLGWGRPVPMDPNKMRNPRWDHFSAVIAGPVSNLLIAGICAIILRLGASALPSGLIIFLTLAVLVNISLFLFNLIPIGPLDGMWIAGTFMSPPVRHQWVRWNLTTGSLVFLGILMLGWVSPELSIVSKVLMPGREFLERLLLGRTLL